MAGVLRVTGPPRGLLFKPQNSLVVQSKHSKLGAETTNGDGFGVGWHGSSTRPGLFFFLALTYGLDHDPPAAVARAVGLIQSAGRRHGIDHPIQMTVATTDGETTWAFR